MSKGAEDIAGRTFGRLTAIERTETPPGLSGKRRGAWWKCKCSCGGEKITCAYSLKAGNVLSCGCLGRERSKRATAERQKRLQEQKEQTQAEQKPLAGINMISVTCRCYSCKKEFERLSPEWRYRAVIGNRERWFCTWGCYRKATNKPKKVHGNSLTEKQKRAIPEGYA